MISISIVSMGRKIQRVIAIIELMITPKNIMSAIGKYNNLIVIPIKKPTRCLSRRHGTKNVFSNNVIDNLSLSTMINRWK